MPTLTRRHALLAGAALPFAGAFAPQPARAAAEMLGAANPAFNRFKLGGFEVTALLGGTRTVPDPNTIFGLNATPEEFAAAADANFIPADKAQFFFTPTIVNTGTELVLFDTGLAGEAITAALANAGYTPDQVDVVVLTHMHGDHIGGLMTGGAPTFANARYVTGALENDTWALAANEGYDANVRPLLDKTSFLDDGGSVASGITAMAAFGHTAGHMIYMLESNGAQLAITADTANHYVWSLGYPDWEVSFDADKAAAAATRRNVFGMLAADKLPFIGYHMPFPAMGYVEAQGSGFRYVPASYQMMLEG
ncbi:MBL fold metallo-hydrolase [Fertoebacter nigrum]|uniref:MBL fold metallo-hydrolase n=1 Tax=Fertoeibacter niger TaxID=2656921 RepID=A0A8X8GYL4_9RHOB|nr:MBL fold metallo-hydrolase [Fertoeibacter niger]NUB46698.1 MBL fold metallo-hydrolase [Fertoeibacter niger]